MKNLNIMMDTNKCKELLNQRKFDEVIQFLEEELINLYKEMIIYSNNEVSENDDLLRLGSKIMKIYPRYFNTIVENENLLISGEYTNGQIIDRILNSYNFLYKNYKKYYDSSKAK